MEEHQAARELLVRLVAGDPGAAAVLRGLMGEHFAFEEELLIPSLAGSLPTGTGPIPVLLKEHAAILALLDQLVASVPGGAPAAPDRTHGSTDGGHQAEGRRLQALLLSHFEKEEELILPFARTHLTSDQLRQIGCVGACEVSTTKGR